MPRAGSVCGVAITGLVVLAAVMHLGCAELQTSDKTARPPTSGDRGGRPTWIGAPSRTSEISISSATPAQVLVVPTATPIALFGKELGNFSLGMVDRPTGKWVEFPQLSTTPISIPPTSAFWIVARSHTELVQGRFRPPFDFLDQRTVLVYPWTPQVFAQLLRDVGSVTERLEIHLERRLGLESLAMLARLPRLRQLTIVKGLYEEYQMDEIVRALPSLPDLEILSVRGGRGVFCPDVVLNVDRFPSLRVLEIFDGQFVSPVTERWGRPTNVEVIDLHSCRGVEFITSSSVVFPRLRELGLSGCAVTAESFRAVASIESLELLSLDRVTVPEAEIEGFVRALKSLLLLDLRASFGRSGSADPWALVRSGSPATDVPTVRLKEDPVPWWRKIPIMSILQETNPRCKVLFP